MLKSLFATCLTALSVNTQALPVSRSIAPSNAISVGTTFNVGDNVKLDFDINVAENSPFTEIPLFSTYDTGVNMVKIISSEAVTLSNCSLIENIYKSPIVFDSFTFYIDSPLQSGDIQFIFGDDAEDYERYYVLLSPSNSEVISLSCSFSITFEILEGFEGFSTEALPYLTKLVNPYTPPAKSNLYRLLYDFYYSIFNDDDLTAISTGYNMPFDNWLAHTCTIATLITLIIVAFFFLRWLFKVISGLILLKR